MDRFSISISILYVNDDCCHGVQLRTLLLLLVRDIGEEVIEVATV